MEYRRLGSTGLKVRARPGNSSEREEHLRVCRVFALRSLRGLLAASWFGLREILAHRAVSPFCGRVDNTGSAPPRGGVSVGLSSICQSAPVPWGKASPEDTVADWLMYVNS